MGNNKKIISEETAWGMLHEFYLNHVDKENLVEIVLEGIQNNADGLGGRLTLKGLAEELKNEGLGEYIVVSEEEYNTKAVKVLYEE